VYSISGGKGQPNIYRRDSVVKGYTADQLLPCFRKSELLKQTTQLNNHIYVANLDDSGYATIYYMSSLGVPLISPRDFVVASEWTRPEENSWLHTSFSLTLDSLPTRSGYVRGHMHLAFIYLKTVEDKDGVSCQLVSCMQSDPKGWIPTAVVNAASPKAMQDGYDTFASWLATNPPPYE